MNYDEIMADDIGTTLKLILDGQEDIREDIKELGLKVENNGKRIDKLGLQIANLEDDAPTIQEFDKLEKRVKKIEVKVASI